MKWLTSLLVLSIAGCSTEKADELIEADTRGAYGGVAAAEIQATEEDLEEVANSMGMKLKLVPAGTFVMRKETGLPTTMINPAHKVTLTNSFMLSVYEVTQE